MSSTEFSPPDLTATDLPRPWHDGLIGRCFVHPVFDYLLIGGGLSLPFVYLALAMPAITPTDQMTRMLVFLALNYAHFASSAVRLYSKPGGMSTFRFLCFGFPVVALAVLTFAVIWPEAIGRHLWALCLTWSPYHYAAQAYGLAMIYCYRSGCRMQPGEKRALWWISMLPFFRAFLNAPDSGLAWFVPNSVFDAQPVLAQIHEFLIQATTILIFALPIWLYLRTRARLPLITLLLLVTNGIWWIVLSYTDAWFWATIFHSIQYLAIVMIYHVKDKLSDEDNRHGIVYYVTTFYAASWVLGFALFLGLPVVYNSIGLGGKQTALMVAAAINIHHFVVDGYIWRSKKGKSNTAAKTATVS